MTGRAGPVTTVIAEAVEQDQGQALHLALRQAASRAVLSRIVPQRVPLGRNPFDAAMPVTRAGSTEMAMEWVVSS